MSTIHAGLTISTKIKPGQKEILEKLLVEIHNEGAFDHSILPFSKSVTTHFVTWVIIPEQIDGNGRKLPERLLLMTSYTGAKKVHLKELVKIGLDGLHKAYQYCDEYPYSNVPTEAELYRYLNRFSIRNTFYTGFQYITHTEAAKENQLREAIQSFLDEAWERRDIGDLPPRMIRQKIQEFVKDDPALAWAAKPYKRSLRDFLKLFGGLIALATVLSTSLILAIIHIFHQSHLTQVGLVIFLGFFGTIVLLVLLLRISEARPHIDIAKVSDARIYEITSRETYPVKNEMSVIAPLKKGLIRRIFLAFTLWLVPFFRAFSYIPTVHTARWLQVDGGRRLIFIANFDNTSEGYAHDFVDSTKRTRNLNLIFGHGQGFPATKFAVGGGGKDRKRYIMGVRAHQKITQVWYSTHQKLSILNLNNNRAIRKGLFGNLNEEEIKQWLLKL
jgi:hypothetical protein